MREKRLRSSDDNSQGDYKRYREASNDEDNQELLIIDSQATISGENEENDRPPTTMMLAQRTQSIAPSLPDRQPSPLSFESTQSSIDILGNDHVIYVQGLSQEQAREICILGGDAFPPNPQSLTETHEETTLPINQDSASSQASEEFNILNYLAPGNDPVQSVVGLSLADAMNICLQQGTDPRILRQRSAQNTTESNEEDANLDSNEYDVNSQLSAGNGSIMSVQSFPDRQPSDYELYFNFTQPSALNRSNTAGTVVPQHSTNQGSNSIRTQEIYFFRIEDYNIPEDIYDNPFDKLSKNMESSVIDLDFSEVLPIAGLFSIILFSYM